MKDIFESHATKMPFHLFMPRTWNVGVIELVSQMKEWAMMKAEPTGIFICSVQDKIINSNDTDLLKSPFGLPARMESTMG